MVSTNAFAQAAAHISGATGVAVRVDQAAHRVDVTIDGQPFTSYLWGGTQRKPFL
jgi:hypothetical protein